ncbi:MAG TPA: indole-3-glycerol phosphate synthase TrpC [Longimicrobiales bacterium]|nr:indole-3-glycerol phosphate synthase TrpC [Longimicrobiales bacterium]
MSVLERIVEQKRESLAGLRARRAALLEGARAAPPARSLFDALRAGGAVAVIAEHKRRSPSAGWIREGSSVAEVVGGYAHNGAAAASILTDTESFGGSLDDLREARAAAALPLLRKDFLIDPVQVEESRAAGADAVLLIVRILEDAALRELLRAAAEWGMDALVEAHDAREVERALQAGARIVGINSRDLATFRTDLAVAERLAAAVPGELVAVAESGIHTAADVDRMGRAGVDAVLVGESLMRAADPGAALRALTGRARARRDARPAGAR